MISMSRIDVIYTPCTTKTKRLSAYQISSNGAIGKNGEHRIPKRAQLNVNIKLFCQVDWFAPYILMSCKVAQELDLAQGTLSENGLFKDLGDLLNGNIFSSLSVLGSTNKVISHSENVQIDKNRRQM